MYFGPECNNNSTLILQKVKPKSCIGKIRFYRIKISACDGWSIVIDIKNNWKAKFGIPNKVRV